MGRKVHLGEEHFRCPIQNAAGLRCTYCHYDALEIGRHLTKYEPHTGQYESNKWRHLWRYISLVPDRESTRLMGLWRSDPPQRFDGAWIPTDPNGHNWLHHVVCPRASISPVPPADI